MPYRTVADLPAAQVDQYSDHQKKAFLKAFNNALNEYHDEHRAFAVAHHAAQQAGKGGSDKEPSPRRSH